MEEDFTKDDVLARWLSGDLTDAEAEALRKRPDYAEYERIVAGVDQLGPPAYDADAALAAMKAKRAAAVKPATVKTKVRRLRPNTWWLAAAGFLLVLLAWQFWPKPTLNYEVLAGQQESINLPDGSQVSLNAVSELSFQEKAGKRLAALSGEGYFEVQKESKPFLVNTPEGTVEVLGTSFNVFARDGEMRVACTSGRVAVRFSGRTETYTLTPGESVAKAASGQVDRLNETDAQVKDWLAGESNFTNQPLAQVIAEMERQFAVVFTIDPAVDTAQLVNTIFPNDDLDRALAIVFNPLTQIAYNRQAAKVSLTTQ